VNGLGNADLADFADLTDVADFGLEFRNSVRVGD